MKQEKSLPKILFSRAKPVTTETSETSQYLKIEIYKTEIIVCNHCNQSETKDYIALKRRNRVTSETGKKPPQNSVFQGETRNH